MHEQYGDQVQFVGVAGSDDVGAAGEFVATYQVGGFPLAFDEDGSVWAEYGVTSQPTFVFISADGEADVQSGRQGEESLTERLEQLVQS